MLLLHRMPTLEPTAANAAFRRFFYSKWGRENCIISACATRAEYPPYVQRLSVKACWGGAERYFVGGRTVAVDDDCYLILNEGREYASLIEAERPVHSFTVFFRPGLAQEVLDAAVTPPGRLLDRGPEVSTGSVAFGEHLQPHDALVTPLLRRIQRQADVGCTDEAWYEEQLGLLVRRMLEHHRRILLRMGRLAPVRAATRREVYRRIARATDYLLTQHASELTIAQLAAVAHMSKFHFLRRFRAIHGTTPFAFLREKRLRAARRLLENTALGRQEIAARVGLRSRVTLFRHLRSAGARPLPRVDEETG